MSKIIIQNNQTLFDISLQVYGTIEAIYLLASANQLGITDNLSPGQIIEVPTSDKFESDILNYYRKNLIKPTTGQSNINELTQPEPLGIGSMIIGTNFKVA